MSKDNQGRDLAGVKRHFDYLAEIGEKGREKSHAEFTELVKRFPLADWTEVKGVLVLRCGNSRYVASPKNGKKTAANFDLIDMDKSEFITVLKKNEVRSWLWRASQEE